MGTETTYTHDDRGLQTSATVTSGVQLGQTRARFMDYDHHGWLVAVRQGTKDERYDYDGYGRQISMRDMKKGHYQTAYNGWGEVVAQRPSLLTYATTQTRKAREDRHVYNHFGDLQQSSDAAGNKSIISYNTFDRASKIDLYPGGTSPPSSTWLYYDKTGTLSWTLDAAGNQTMVIHDAHNRKVTQSRIVTEDLTSGHKGPTLTQVSTTDLAGWPETANHIDRDTLAQGWQYNYNAAGDLLDTVNPEGVIATSHTHNLAGWVTDTERPRHRSQPERDDQPGIQRLRTGHKTH